MKIYKLIIREILAEDGGKWRCRIKDNVIKSHELALAVIGELICYLSPFLHLAALLVSSGGVLVSSGGVLVSSGGVLC